MELNISDTWVGKESLKPSLLGRTRIPQSKRKTREKGHKNINILIAHTKYSL
jgi:hypothetical protein